MTLRTNEASEGAAEAMGTPLRVLLVEDSENDALLLLRELRRGGYEPIYERVDTPEGMERALASSSVWEEPWEMVISDYYMPRFEAPDALVLLRRLGYETPFIVVSGKVGEDAAVEVMRAGAHDYVTKENMARLCPAIERELREAEVRKKRARAEEALRRSEQRFQRLVEQAADAIFVHDLQGNFIDGNRRACESLGYSREELLDMCVADVEVNYTRGSLEKLWAQVVEGTPRTLEGVHRRKDGTLFPVEIRAGVFESNSQQLILTLVRDISERKQAEEALRESEERFRATFEQAAVGISHVSPDGRWLRVNEKLCEIVGYDRDELLGMSFRDITHPDDLDQDLEHLRQMLEGKTDTYSVEKRYVRKDGSVIWVKLTTSLLRDPSGEPKYFISVTEDITPRKRAEATLKESEEHYRAVVEQSAEGILLVDVETKRILEVNAAYRTLLGYNSEEILRLRLYDLVPYSQEAMDCYVQRVQEQRNYVSGARRHRRKDGSLVDIEVSANMISYGGREAMCMVIRDVTERKRTEEALRKSESSLSAAQRIAHLGNWDYDIARDEAYWSDELYRIFGFTPQAFVPTYKKFLDLVHPDDRDLLRREVRAALYGGHERSPSSIECRVVRPDGEVRFVSTQYEVVHDEPGRPVGLIGTIHDVTERKRAEEALREIKETERRRIARDLHDGALQDLSYTTAAMGLIRRKAKGTGLEEEVQKTIDAVRRAAQELRVAVYDLRLEEERDRPFRELVGSLVKRNRIRARGYEIRLEIEEGFPATSLGDAGMEILRVLQEALTNARRHSGAQRVRVTLWAEGGDLIAEVSDDGRGFETETAPGIGLRSMRERAAALSGELDVQSEPDGGTRVRLRAPLPGLLRKRLTSS